MVINESNDLRKNVEFRKKTFCHEGWILTFDDVICLPGYTHFPPEDVNINSHIGPYHFHIPIITAAMDTVTEDQMAIQMALLGGLGVIHRNCPYERQLEMVRKVKRARSFIIDDVATVSPDITVREIEAKMARMGISGFVVVDAKKKVLGIVTRRDLPFDPDFEGRASDIMTKNPICLPSNVSREEALAKLYQIRKEKIPLVDAEGILIGLITKKDLKPNYPNSATDEKGRLLCALACSPFMPKSPEKVRILKEISTHVDILFPDVAAVYKMTDLNGIKQLMDTFDCKFVIGNIGTYEAAEFILTKMDYDPKKLIGLKVGMGSGSICTTTIQTGVGAPTLFAAAQVADAIKDYNPKISLVADGGFKNPGDLTKAFAVGADMVMSGHFFAGCSESPGYIDTIEGRKVKVYRGMGSAEARAIGSYADDRYNVNSQKKLTEGVSGYVPFVGDLSGVLDQLIDGLKNGLIYGGAKDIGEAYNIRLGHVSIAGQIEAKPHDLI